MSGVRVRRYVRTVALNSTNEVSSTIQLTQLSSSSIIIISAFYVNDTSSYTDVPGSAVNEVLCSACYTACSIRK